MSVSIRDTVSRTCERNYGKYMNVIAARRFDRKRKVYFSMYRDEEHCSPRLITIARQRSTAYLNRSALTLMPCQI